MKEIFDQALGVKLDTELLRFLSITQESYQSSQPSESEGMNHLDLFSGIGGFAMAVDTVWPGSTHTFSDNDPFCQAVLKKHWPGSLIHGNIKELVCLLNEQKMQSTLQSGGSVTQKRSGSIGEIGTGETRSGQIPVPGKSQSDRGQSRGAAYSTPTGTGATAAERRRQSSSPSTTGTTMGTRIGKGTEPGQCTNSQRIGDIPTPTSYSATTATKLKDTTAYALTNGKVDILTGGFPCQSFSQAGKRRGTADARWLWPEMFRVIQLTLPRFVIAENVRGLTNWQGGLAFEQVCSDLEGIGYEVQPLQPAMCEWMMGYPLGLTDVPVPARTEPPGSRH